VSKVNTSKTTSSPIVIKATENKSDEEDVSDVSMITFSPYLPPRPFYIVMTEHILEWGRTKECPKLRYLPFFEKSINYDSHNRVNGLTDQVVKLFASASTATATELKAMLVDLLTKLGVRGIMTLLGIQCTIGSGDILPPSRDMLMKSFTTSHSGSSLTVGGRALTKHFHRGTDRWWGEISGTDSEKNKRALILLLRFMRGAVWLNIHGLPGQVQVLEMRIANGYGARWTADGASFRGFLEPHMVDGWKTGWKH